MIDVTDPNQFIWYQKYRPNKVDDCILPISVKKNFKEFVAKGDIPNMIFAGPPGSGKTTSAKALLNELGFDSYFVNSSLKGNIDTLRNEIMEYASTVSFSDGRKFVILDEADNLNINSTQPALRAFMEEYSSNCGFILTCNYPSKIMDAIHSRCVTVDFKFPKAERQTLMVETIRMLSVILKKEGIKFDPKIIALVVKSLFPNIRKIINNIQENSSSGELSIGAASGLTDENFTALIDILKSKKFNDMRKWVGENSDIEWTQFITKLYENADGKVREETIPALVLLLQKFDYERSFVTNIEIHFAALLTSIMSEVNFK